MIQINKKILFFVFIFIVIPLYTYPHGKKKHNEPTGKNENKTVNVKESKPYVYKDREPDGFIDHIFVKLPTLHPIIIHFPIVLSIMAFPIYFIGVFFRKKDFKWLAIITSAGGFLGGIGAAYLVHPHTKGLSKGAAEVLKYHEQFADITIVFSGLSALAGLIFLILKLEKRIFEYIVLLLMVFSIISVSITGHFGGSLVYLHGVGSQGNNLEMDKKH